MTHQATTLHVESLEATRSHVRYKSMQWEVLMVKKSSVCVCLCVQNTEATSDKEKRYKEAENSNVHCVIQGVC